MPRSDDIAGALLLGGLLGAALASSPPGEKAELAEYRNIKAQVANRINRIGDLSVLEKLKTKPHLSNLFREVVGMHSNGFYRGSSLFCSVIMEDALREQLGAKENYAELIDHAKEKRLISASEAHYLNGTRTDRNNLAHNATLDCSEEESLMTILITKKVLQSLVANSLNPGE